MENLPLIASGAIPSKVEGNAPKKKNEDSDGGLKTDESEES